MNRNEDANQPILPPPCICSPLRTPPGPIPLCISASDAFQANAPSPQEIPTEHKEPWEGCRSLLCPIIPKIQTACAHLFVVGDHTNSTLDSKVEFVVASKWYLGTPSIPLISFNSVELLSNVSCLVHCRQSGTLEKSLVGRLSSRRTQNFYEAPLLHLSHSSTSHHLPDAVGFTTFDIQAKYSQYLKMPCCLVLPWDTPKTLWSACKTSLSSNQNTPRILQTQNSPKETLGWNWSRHTQAAWHTYEGSQYEENTQHILLKS